MNSELSKKAKMAIAKFLNTEAGEELKGYLAFLTPSISISEQAHVMHFTSGQTQGWGQCLKEIEKLSTLKGDLDTSEKDDTLDR